MTSYYLTSSQLTSSQSAASQLTSGRVSLTSGDHIEASSLLEGSSSVPKDRSAVYPIVGTVIAIIGT